MTGEAADAKPQVDQTRSTRLSSARSLRRDCGYRLRSRLRSPCPYLLTDGRLRARRKPRSLRRFDGRVLVTGVKPGAARRRRTSCRSR